MTARMRRTGATVVSLVRDWTPDAMLLGGAAAVAYGAGLVFVPAGFIVGGVLLLVGGYLASRRASA